MGTLGQNLRFALRQLRRNSGFTATVVLTLALSIGANTAIFSLVDALMLRSLPYPHPDRMGTIFLRVQGGQQSEDGGHWIDGEQWEALRDNVPALLSAVFGGVTNANFRAGAHVEYVHAGRVSAHYLDVLGLHPFLGRNFTSDEDRPNGPKAAILSYNLWRTTFSGDRNIIGQAVDIKGAPYTVVGILPQGATTPLDADLYTPLQPSRTGEGGGTNYGVITRLRDGATWQQADAEINRAWAARAQRFAREYPTGAHVSYYSVSLQKGQTATLRAKAVTLMLAAGLILLIACANLAGLTLVGVLQRTSEFATRLALGASRGQIQRQLWIENLLLALIGGLAGVGAGYLALRGLLSLLPEGFLPVPDVSLDPRVLGFTLAVSLCTSVLFGMLPALATRRVDVRSAMATRTTAGTNRLRLRQALIAGEVALTVVLLAASGLLIRSLVHLETLPPGFNANGVLTAKASLDDSRYHDPAAFRRLLAESTAAMERIPGVQRAAVALSLPYERGLNDVITIHNGPGAGQQIASGEVYVTPGFFDVLQIPLLAGRTFASSDGPDTQPVAVVNQTFARKFFPGINPIGNTLNKGTVIVGVVADVKVVPGLDSTDPVTSEETVYIPAAQFGGNLLPLVHIWYQPSWIVRTATPVDNLSGQMQHALSSVDPGLPFSGFYSMNDLLAKALTIQRIEVALLGAMAALALLLSAIGIFALVANMVTQRTREIGIRIALGSTIRHVMTHVAGAGLRAAAAGILLGLALSAGALRAMRSALYGVSVYDVPSLLAVVASMTLITLLATGLPTARIARIDPAQSLRDE
ncbi:MAG TPA: ADOP family duplicated permease [Terracidiphilus sp.]|jgi:predicted permease|nr:ADOP family duplicated permease [Terracidiphilus sp.]